MRRILSFVLVAAALTGCASKPRIVPVAEAPPPAPAAPAFGGYGNLDVPIRLADGSYVTPNRGVSAAGALWHLRAGLNVAALSCRGPQEAALVAGYNALLQRHRAAFDQAYKTLSREYGDAAAFDAAMTRLYNYYALPPAQPGLCAAAQAVLTDAAAVPADGIGGFATTGLARIEAPYTQMFARQEAWLAGRNPAASPVLIAAAAPAPRIAPAAVKASAAPAPAARPAATMASAAPRLKVDPAVFRLP